MDDIHILIEPISDPDDDSVKVGVTLASGTRYWATFVTIENLRSTFDKNAHTGEHAQGTYLPAAPNLVIVKTLTRAIIKRTVADLLETKRLESVFSIVAPRDEEASPAE